MPDNREGLQETSTNWVCPACGRRMMSGNELCSGGFLDDHHPSNVRPVVGNPPVRES